MTFLEGGGPGHELAALPQTCLRNDRLSALGQWGLPEGDALAEEFALGMHSLVADAREGAARFRDGEGRGGAQRSSL